MTTVEPIARVRKNAREEIHIDLQEFKGQQLASIRVWFGAADGSMRPGKDGINFRLAILPEIAAGVNAALDEARRRGLLDD